MVFRASTAPVPKPLSMPSTVHVLFSLDSVDVQAGLLTGTAIPTSGQATSPTPIRVRMDTIAIPMSQRQGLGTRARGSFFGGLIDSRLQTLADSTQILVAEDARPDTQDPGLYHARWLVSLGQRDRVIHGPANLQTYIDARGHVAVGRIRVWSSSLIPLDNQSTMRSLKKRMAHAARRSQLIGNATDPATGRMVYGSSMRRYVFTMLAIGPDNVLLERSPVLSVHIPKVWPNWVPESMRYSNRGGEMRPRAIPVDDEFLDQAVSEFRAYLSQRYDNEPAIFIGVGCDLRPSQDAPIATHKPYSEANREKLAVLHRENRQRHAPSPDAAEAEHECGLGVTEVLLGLSPQLRNINDYVMKAVLAYPNRHFLDYFTIAGQPLHVPPGLLPPMMDSEPSGTT